MQVSKQNVKHESKTKTGNFTVRTEKARLERFLFFPFFGSDECAKQFIFTRNGFIYLRHIESKTG